MRAFAICGSLVTVGATAQTGYQYEQLAPDPVLKTPSTLESMLMRAGYEQRHRDCLDAGFHINAVLAKGQDWSGAWALRLYCEQREGRRVDELADLTTLINLQPKNWRWYSERARVHAEDLDREAAMVDLYRAIALRPWEPELYVRRSYLEEDLRDYVLAFADLVKVHELLPEQAGPLLNMAARVVLYGGSESEAMRYRKLAEIAAPKPEDSPRNDDEVKTVGMSSEEAMLRAGYAKSLGKRSLELRFLNAALDQHPGLQRALEMRIEIEMMERGSQVLPHSYEPAGRFIPFPTRSMREIRNRMRMAEVACRDSSVGAFGDVQRLICADPNRPDYYRIRIRILSSAHRANLFLPMLSDYGKVLDLERYEGSNYVARAQFQMEEGDLLGAEDDFHAALALDPGNAGYSYQLAQVYKAQRFISKEIITLNLALVGEPENAVWLRERADLP